jgi:CRP/FNR family transcriptional regulator, cyclic AMP receptor protein
MKDKFEIVRLLSNSFLFSGLTGDEFDKISKFAKLSKMARGETVFFKGDEGNSMFAVISGRLKVQNVSEEGKTLILGFLEPGAVFGEIAVLDSKPRTASVVSVEPSELLVIERAPFLRFLEAHPSVAIKLMMAMCERLRTTDEFLENMVFMSLPTRLARMLRLLAERYGTASPGGIEIGMRISQAELANLVGASRESVNKQLRAWEEDGLISNMEGLITADPKLFTFAE